MTMFTQPKADQLVQAATVALANGNATRAAALLDEALKDDPNHLMAQTKRSELALLRKDFPDALTLTEAVLAIEPNFAPALYHRASALWSVGRQTEAVTAAELAVDIQPPNPDYRLRLAQFAAWTGDSAKTKATLAPLLAYQRRNDPHYAAATSMLGELAIAEGRFNDANSYFDRALKIQPDLAVTRMQRGMNHLRLGQFRQGWTDYAAREGIAALYPDGQPAVARQQWQGQPLAGKTLAVIDDQGNGDAIQFFRYLPLLRDRGAAHIIWRTFPALVRLLSDAATGATITNMLDPNARFDFQCNSTSLPRWFATELPSIPAQVPYLWAPKRLKSKIKLPGAQKRMKVGLVWSGDPRHPRDHLRSIPAERFLRLSDIPNVSFHSLQHEVRSADLPALTARPAISREVEQAVDLADTAALIARLDLVVTVDTAIAHLAGAMGKPVWLVLHLAPDWRWLVDRFDTPWYPSARLFRVARSEWPRDITGADWAPVLDRVAAALRESAAAWINGGDAQPGIIRPRGRPPNK